MTMQPIEEVAALPISEMTDRELLEEIVRNMRSVTVALAQFEQSPMVQAMKNGTNPLMAMMKG